MCTFHLILFLCDESSRNAFSLEEITISLECLRIARILLDIPSSSLQISSLVLDLWRWRQCNQSSNMNSFLVNFGIFFLRLEVRHLPMRMKPPKNLLLKWVCEHFFNVRHGVEPHVLEDDSVNRVFCTSVIQILKSKFCPLEGFLSLYQWTSFSDVSMKDCCCCCRCRRCCLRRGRDFPHRGGNGFPMHAWRCDLRFNVVRILWTLLVIFHGRFGRFEAYFIEILFLLAQFV